VNPAVLFPVVLASLLGSVHCAGMCGGFVAAYAGDGGSESARSHLAYNAGRLVTYTSLGALAGALGGALDFAGQSVGLGRAAALLTGGLLVLVGVARLWQGPRLVTLRAGAPRGPLRWLGALLARVHGQPPARRALLLGLTTTLLPCGFLYSFVAVAAGSGSAAYGAAVMGAFWLGTLPALFGAGVSLAWLGGKLRAHLPRLAALCSVALGLLTLGLRALPEAPAPSASSQHGADCPFHRGSAP
jgi:sulfite exporter TauE/SafE